MEKIFFVGHMHWRPDFSGIAVSVGLHGGAACGEDVPWPDWRRRRLGRLGASGSGNFWKNFFTPNCVVK